MAESFDHLHQGEPRDLDKIKKAVHHVWSFLRDFISLANTHGAEFISQRHWELHLPQDIGGELLSIKEEELASLPVSNLVPISEKLCYRNGFPFHITSSKCDMTFINSGHPVENDFFCEQKVFCSQLNHINVKDSNSEFKDGLRQLKISSQHEKEKTLNSIIHGALDCHLENLDILSSFADACGSNVNEKHVISEAMSEKKCHEVQLMSNAIAAMIGRCQCDLVVDVGSGKGYLSMELASHHRIGVLGLDSCATNTHGAKLRKDKLSPKLPGLISKQEKQYLKNQKDHECFSNKPIESSPVLSPECANEKAANSESTVAGNDNKCTSLYVPLTLFVDPGMNLESVITNHAVHLCGNKDPDNVSLLLAGLHTCGSLAVSTMQLFLKDSSVKAMCCVGCCYQLMDEEISHDSDSIGQDKCDFPLSAYGKALGLHLGRNARNLASQSVHRTQASKQLQGKDFYWRALLDVLLRNLSLPVPDRIIGMRGLNKQCGTFYEYALKAFHKLGFPSDLITEMIAQDLEEKYRQEQTKMTAFFQLKLVLSPVIESLILLDRLLFLAEQDCVQEAHLVQLFDPLTSPRCFALMGYKTDPTPGRNQNSFEESLCS